MPEERVHRGDAEDADKSYCFNELDIQTAVSLSCPANGYCRNSSLFIEVCFFRTPTGTVR